MIATSIRHRPQTSFTVTRLINTCAVCCALNLGFNADATEMQPQVKSAAITASADSTLTSTSALENDASLVLKLIEDSHALREKLPTFINEASNAIDQHKGALPAAYTLKIINTLSVADAQRDGLFKQALKHRSALYRVDDHADDQERIQEIIIGLSAAVTLYENNKIIRNVFSNKHLLRKKINEGYPEFGVSSKFYDSSMTRATTPEYAKNLSDAVHFFNDNKTVIAEQVANNTPTIQKLYAVIAQSPVLDNMHTSNVFKEIALIPVKIVDAGVHVSKHGLRSLQFRASQVTGNTMGIIRWRDGKLKNDKDVLAAMLAELQPGDILLEKTPFALTDKSIPGHFGHAAIYTGSVEQLQAIQALDMPMVQKNREKIAAGHTVVEALRNGVQLDTLQDFMNIDDVAVLRLKNVTTAQQRESVNLALANLGKKYDFNFDVNTTDTIVCSELVYIAYPEVDFVTKNVLGSFTVSPDDIAQRAGSTESDPLEVIFFAHDGKLVCDQKQGHQQDGLALYDTLVKSQPTNATNTQKKAVFEGFVH